MDSLLAARAKRNRGRIRFQKNVENAERLLTQERKRLSVAIEKLLKNRVRAGCLTQAADDRYTFNARAVLDGKTIDCVQFASRTAFLDTMSGLVNGMAKGIAKEILASPIPVGLRVNL